MATECIEGKGDEPLFEAWDVKRNVLLLKFDRFSSWGGHSHLRYEEARDEKGYPVCRDRNDLNLKLPNGEWWDPYNVPYDYHEYPATSLYEEITGMLSDGEAPTCVRLSDRGGDNIYRPTVDHLMTWEEALPDLKRFTSSWGPKGIVAIVWTNQSVILTEGYDTSSSLTKIPRHPDPEFIPDYIGGGC